MVNVILAEELTLCQCSETEAWSMLMWPHRVNVVSGYKIKFHGFSFSEWIAISVTDLTFQKCTAPWHPHAGTAYRKWVEGLEIIQ